MFKKIKKNTNKLEFLETETEDTGSIAGSIPSTNHRLIRFEDEDMEHIQKKIKPIAHMVPKANKAIPIEVENYTSEYLQVLHKITQIESATAKEFMNEQNEHNENNDPIEINSDIDVKIVDYELDKVRREVLEQLESSDDEVQKKRTKQLLSEKHQNRKKEEFKGFSSELVDENWIRDTDKHRVPLMGAVSKHHHGEFDSLPSGSDEEEWNTLEESIIRNNASEKRRAQIRTETLYQELGNKLVNFNDKRQAESGDSRLISKLNTISFESVIQDVKAAITVEKGLLQRIESHCTQLNEALSSSKQFVEQWTQQLEGLEAEAKGADQTLEFIATFHDMAREKVPELFRAYDTLADISEEHREMVIAKSIAFENANPLNEDFDEIFRGEPLFLLVDYSTALKEILSDVDSQYISVSTIAENCMNYFKSTQTVSQENSIIYTLQIVYPFFKFHFLLRFLNCYINTSQSIGTMEQFMTPLEPGLQAILIAELMKTTLTHLIQMAPLNLPIIRQLIQEVILKTYKYAQSQNDHNAQKRYLGLIKHLLDQLIENSKYNIGPMSFFKLNLLISFKSLLPKKNLLDCLRDCIKELHNLKYDRDRICSIIEQDEDLKNDLSDVLQTL